MVAQARKGTPTAPRPRTRPWRGVGARRAVDKLPAIMPDVRRAGDPYFRSVSAGASQRHGAYYGGPPGMSFRQARCAAWNTGELGLMPVGICMLMPVALTTGSAMPGRPWARMQATHFGAWAVAWRCWAAVIGWVGGSRCWHALLAATNWGEP